MFAQLIENPAEMSLVGIRVRGKYENIIKIYRDEEIELFTKDLIDQLLKGS